MEHVVHASVEVSAAETDTASSIEITEIPIEKRTLCFLFILIFKFVIITYFCPSAN